MGVVNVTPDSFFDGGRYFDADAAVLHGQELITAGADILDLGGESSRPGAEPVTATEESGRVLPVLAGLMPEASKTGVRISVDTTKLEVAEAALEQGAEIINDISALRNAPEIGLLCADTGATLVLMHMLGNPRTMQADPRYGDVVAEVKAFLSERIEVALAAGISEDRIWVDPGIGFGKTVEHNLALIARLGEIAELGLPVLAGTSRKRFLGSFDASPPEGRLGGTISSTLSAWQNGADILRVHDVGAMRQALTVAEAIEAHRVR